MKSPKNILLSTYGQNVQVPALQRLEQIGHAPFQAAIDEDAACHVVEQDGPQRRRVACRKSKAIFRFKISLPARRSLERGRPADRRTFQERHVVRRHVREGVVGRREDGERALLLQQLGQIGRRHQGQENAAFVKKNTAVRHRPFWNQNKMDVTIGK